MVIQLNQAQSATLLFTHQVPAHGCIAVGLLVGMRASMSGGPHGRGLVEEGEHNPFLAPAVQIWDLQVPETVVATVAPTDTVRHAQHDVGGGISFCFQCMARTANVDRHQIDYD